VIKLEASRCRCRQEPRYERHRRRQLGRRVDRTVERGELADTAQPVRLEDEGSPGSAEEAMSCAVRPVLGSGPGRSTRSPQESG
jgi:hypothetical protein